MYKIAHLVVYARPPLSAARLAQDLTLRSNRPRRKHFSALVWPNAASRPTVRVVDPNQIAASRQSVRFAEYNHQFLTGRNSGWVIFLGHWLDHRRDGDRGFRVGDSGAFQ
jgi:hypothetical protein